MSRRVDRKATRAARERHAAGVKRLNAAFTFPHVSLHESIRLSGGDKHTGRPRPVRLRPGVPPIRPDAEYRKRRRRRKLARASRKRNRT